MLGTKLKTVDTASGCPWPQTGTLNTNLRTFFAALKNLYQWTYDSDDFRGFSGCLHGNLKDEYDRRMLKWVSNVDVLFDA